jgi:hypothetical protein
MATITKSDMNLISSLKRNVKELSLLPESDLIDLFINTTPKSVVAKQKVVCNLYLYIQLALLCKKTPCSDSSLASLLDTRKKQRRAEVGENTSTRIKANNLSVYNIQFQDAFLDHIRILGFDGREKLAILTTKVDLALVVGFLLDKIKVDSILFNYSVLFENSNEKSRYPARSRQ